MAFGLLPVRRATDSQAPFLFRCVAGTQVNLRWDYYTTKEVNVNDNI
jgi:hypothetical protein